MGHDRKAKRVIRKFAQTVLPKFEGVIDLDEAHVSRYVTPISSPILADAFDLLESSGRRVTGLYVAKDVFQDLEELEVHCENSVWGIPVTVSDLPQNHLVAFAEDPNVIAGPSFCLMKHG